MNKYIKLMLIAVTIPLLLTISCQKEVAEPIAVTTVSLNAESAELTEGEEIQLVATVSPNNAENKTVIWSSSNASIASVIDGKVTALKVGKATITVKTDDGGKTATCKVTVNAKVYPVTSVSLDKTSVEMTEGDELTLTAIVKPDNATNKNVTWTSSNSSVASVSNGKVTALKAGKATITVKTEDGAKTATCEITVNAKVYPVTAVTLDKTSATLTEGDELTLIATVKPDNATNKNVTWTSSNSSVASVSNGKVTALKAGKATITVKTEDGAKTATCEVTVNAKVYPVTGVTLDKSSATLTEGDELILIATVNPDNATNKNVTWSSSNSSVASVSNGRVTALKAGKATITVKTDDGGKTATCEVTVNAKAYPVTGVTLDKSSATLTEGDELILIATVNPDNATNKNVTWSSSNSSVASVSNGRVTALKAGKATITVKTDDGGKTATCEVTVNAKVYPVTGVTLDKSSATLTEGDEITLTATVKPDNATNKNVTWTSSNSSVASVSNGRVIALKAGKATITVKTDDGGKTATCEVTVNAKVYPVTGVTLDKSSATLTEGDEITLTATVKPDNATNKNVNWSSSNSSVASVSNGKVTALKAGKATITVKTDDGGKTAACEVTVNAKVYPVTGVTLDKSSATLTEGDELTLTATVNPDNATNKNVTWTSSNSSVASVSNGKVTALKAGKATITVKTDDGNKIANCEVTIISKGTGDNTDIIAFADAVMKELCVNSFDTNGDGELSYAEAAAVTDLNQLKLTKKTFKTFDEFQYFTSVKSIPRDYFKEIGIKSIKLPKSVTSIGYGAFSGCSGLTSITIPESVTRIGDYTFYGCSGLTSITIPESVTSIGDYTFYGCSGLTSITIPESVTSIGYGAFYGCSGLTSITIPESVTSIGGSAFNGCISLTSVTIPESVTSIGNYAFNGCTSLTSVTIPESVTSIGNYAFWSCTSLTSVTIPESVTRIGDYTFYGCSGLTSITIPESVTRIGDYTFSGCSGLTSITIPESVTSIGYGAFSSCSGLTSITIPESVTSIGNYAFYGCTSLTSVTIPESVTSIGGSAFNGCTSLTSVTIPESVTSIGNCAFWGCTSLTSVILNNTVPPKIYLDSFKHNASGRKFHVPSEAVETYKSADVWSSYASSIVGY